MYNKYWLCCDYYAGYCQMSFVFRSFSGVSWRGGKSFIWIVENDVILNVKCVLWNLNRVSKIFEFRICELDKVWNIQKHCTAIHINLEKMYIFWMGTTFIWTNQQRCWANFIHFARSKVTEMERERESKIKKIVDAKTRASNPFI